MTRRELLIGITSSLAGAAVGSGVLWKPGKKTVPDLHLHLCAFHIGYEDNRQVEVHLYCQPLSSQLSQCVVYDAPPPRGRILGVEYVIDEALYGRLSAEERTYWHSHSHDVKTGVFLAPGFDLFNEERVIQGLARTWGKAWHTWPDKAELPLGPALLYGSSSATQMIDRRLLDDRNRRLHHWKGAVRGRP